MQLSGPQTSCSEHASNAVCPPHLLVCNHRQLILGDPSGECLDGSVCLLELLLVLLVLSLITLNLLVALVSKSLSLCR